MQHEILFSKGKKHTYLRSLVLKSDSGLRNKRTPRGKQETEIFIHSVSDAEWILARTYFPRISQLLSEFKKETPIILQENFAFLLFLINKDFPHLRSKKEWVLLLIIFGFCCWMFGEGKIKKGILINKKFSCRQTMKYSRKPAQWSKEKGTGEGSREVMYSTPV